MKKPLVSVCIPTYNGQKYIEEAIKSVLKQTYVDFELIIRDDGSSDHTEQIINSFTDNRIRFIKNDKNVGMVTNWNLCLANAKGKYIKILCHDDVLETNCLEECVNVFEKNDDIAIVFNSTFIINDSGETVMMRRPFKSSILFDGIALAQKSFRHHNIFGEPSNIMFRKTFAEKAGNFDENLCYSVDWLYWIFLCILGKAYYIDQYLASFRLSPSSATSKLFRRKGMLVKDDKLFISRCKKKKILKIRKCDVLLHQVSIFIRAYVRELMFALYNKNSIIQQFVKFGVVGITNTVVSLMVYYVLVSYNVNFIVANTVGFIAGGINAYYWNNKYVFETKVGILKQAKSLLKVFMIYGFTFLVNTIFLYGMVNFLQISKYVAPIINASILTPVNYALNKFWAFK